MQSSKEEQGEIRKPSSVIKAKKKRKTVEWVYRLALFLGIYPGRIFPKLELLIAGSVCQMMLRGPGSLSQCLSSLEVCHSEEAMLH